MSATASATCIQLVSPGQFAIFAETLIIFQAYGKPFAHYLLTKANNQNVPRIILYLMTVYFFQIL